MSKPNTASGRLILVSNRLPIIVREEADQLSIELASGGLATGLSGPHQETQGRWIGWPGMQSPGGGLSGEVQGLLDKRGMTGIPLSSEEYDSYYMQVANRSLWPLFHYFTDRVHYQPKDWEVYERINQRFAEATAAEAQPGDRVFIQDFHLMLVPAMLREMRPDLSIGFFLHIPFPSSEIFRIFPKRKQILEGLLGADVVGFHTLDYTRHFRSSVRRVLGLETSAHGVQYDGREVRLMAQPLGLDVPTWQTPSTDPAIAAEMLKLSEAAAGRKIVLGVERLDYTKGIPERLQAFHNLLANRPEWNEKVMMIQIAVPSRIEAEEYADLADKAHQLAGEINSKFGQPGLQPLHYQFRGVPKETLIAMYRMADVAVVTPLRDGLNLVAKEYVAARSEDDGVLVLSEFAGAALELGEALQVSPFDLDSIEEAMAQGLEMDAQEQEERMAPMRQRVIDADVHAWTSACLGALDEVPERRSPSMFSGQITAQWSADFKSAQKRLVLLDYDGTLRPFAEHPDQATPDKRLLALLKRIGNDPNTDAWIVSGRPSEFLAQHLSGLGFGLVGEHGGMLRGPHETEFTPGGSLPDDEWKNDVLQIMEQVAQRVPGSHIEHKSMGLGWHYRAARSSAAETQAGELYQHLGEVLSGQGLDVLAGNKVIEVRPTELNKGRAARTILENYATTPDWILAAGDDTTDEDLFHAMPAQALTLLVGERPSSAHFRLCSCSALLDQLERWYEPQFQATRTQS
ncbi:MAG: bifunctional alpha,alpha-trehalose-phosphate synthase (UDP-forming)/trehalose-phosphatase [bacterium]|nr:bifunctional alpha,alpha-trehalose-phosphate synthase (UDP-forming)/trehalose-phosphatase [bacterium]